jgi:hypothetical protein
MDEITTIGLDIAKNVSSCMVSTRMDRLYCASRCAAGSCSVLREAASLPDRNGSLRYSPPLGKDADDIWPRRLARL